MKPYIFILLLIIILFFYHLSLFYFLSISGPFINHFMSTEVSETKMDTTPIYFWKESELPYGFLSNYYASTITYQGKEYASSEVLYQSLKFLDPEYQEIVRSAKTIHQSKVLATQKIDHHSSYPWRLELNPIIKRYLDKGVTI